MIKPRFSEATSNLIERMANANLSQNDFDLAKATAAVREAYAVADQEIPEKINIVDDPQNDDLWDLIEEKGAFTPSQIAATLLGMIRSDYFSFSEVESAWQAWVQGAARAARADFVYPCGISVDKDFDLYISAFEYWQATGAMTVLERDAMDILECLLQAREAGLGWMAEVEGELYLIPAAKVHLDDQNEFHSETGPAIVFASGYEEYYLHGAIFLKELWEKIVAGRITLEELSMIRNEHAMAIALHMVGRGRKDNA